MPRTKKQFEEMSQKSKELIMNSALKLFANKGFHSTTIRDIADKAGISVGLMYNYFSSKEDLLENIFDKNIKEFRNLIKSSEDTDDISVLLKNMFDTFRKDANYFTLFSISLQPDVLSCFGDKLAKVFDSFTNEFEKYFRKVGAKNPDLEAKILSIIVYGIFIKITSSHLLKTKERKDLDFVIKEIIKRSLTEVKKNK